MWSIIIAMVVILAVAGLVITYAAYPHRGEDVPKARWIGTAMRRAAQRAPVLPREDERGTTPQSHLMRR